MPSQDNQITRLVSAQLLIALLAGGAYFLYDRPFESSRVSTGQSTDMFEARLWEDPLNTVYGIRSISEQRRVEGNSDSINSFLNDPEISINSFTERVKSAVNSTTSDEINVFGVMMPEGQHSLTIETRRRIRFAIISALNQTKIPTQSERMTLVNTGISEEPTVTDLISYEIYQPYDDISLNQTEQVPKTTLILWIPSNVMSGDAIGQYQDILSALKITAARNEGDATSEDSVTTEWLYTTAPILFGPTSSNELVDMIGSYLTLKLKAGADELESLLISLALFSGRPEEISQTRMLADDILSVVGIADEYLDFGFSKTNRTSFELCLNRQDDNSVSDVELLNTELVQDCLNNLSINDSDPDWESWVVRNWDSQKRTRTALNRIPMAAEDKEKILELIDSLHWELDEFAIENTLVSNFESTLVDCMSATDGDYSWGSEFVVDCLENIARPENSAPEDGWRQRIATNFDKFYQIENYEPTYNVQSQDARNELTPEEFDRLIPRDSIVILSPRATIPNQILLNELQQTARKYISAPEDTSRPAEIRIPGLYRTLDADDQLLFAIHKELLSRGFTNDARIALIYEGDGKYGRALQQVLDCSSSFNRDSILASDSQSTNTSACFTNVDSFAYLRGLDGIRPEDNSVQSAGNSQSSSIMMSNLLAVSESLEQSFGRHQFDYLRRLSDAISSNSYDAIGVLGTDVFDKLLVLQALREKNQHAVFFTTDLDATMLHGREFDWTQNLLVASAFDLSLSQNRLGNSCDYMFDSYKGSVSTAPFRESYQTAYFQSVCLGLYISEWIDTPTDAEIRNKVSGYLNDQTRVYEVGRSRPVMMASSSQAGENNSNSISFEFLSRSVQASLGWFLLMTPTFLLLCLSVLAWNRERARRTSQSLQKFSIPWALRTSALVCLTGIMFMVALLLAESLTEDGEPLLILEGVSHWPTTLLRIQVVIFSITFGLYSYSRWLRSNDEITSLVVSTEQLKEPLNEELPVSLSAWIHDIEKDNEKGQKPKNIGDIWKIYCQLARLKPRMKRVIPKALLWTAIVFVCYYAFTPYPGLIRDSYPLANFLFGHGFVLLVSIISLFMISLANDVTNLSRIFVKALARYKIIWDKPVDYLLPTKFGSYEQICSPLCVMEVIACRTRDITPLVIFPFGTLLLVVISRSVIFEGWNWSVELICAYLIITATSLYYALLLQKEAAAARTQAINDLEQLRTEKSNWESVDINHSHFDTCVRAGLDYARSINKGAFVPWFRHPIFQALLLPFTGTTGLLILQSI